MSLALRDSLWHAVTSLWSTPRSWNLWSPLGLRSFRLTTSRRSPTRRTDSISYVRIYYSLRDHQLRSMTANRKGGDHAGRHEVHSRRPAEALI
jgi:hypothetical protein